MLDAGASGRRVSFNAHNERLPRGENSTERTCQGLGACRDGSPSLPGSSWRLCTPSGSARTQEHMGESAQCRDPLAQTWGVRAGLMKDMLNEGRRPENR